ncbi:MAG TPA: hypothetical protein VIX37_12590 [Candidatus Sulfotelmatobacter sp.]
MAFPSSTGGGFPDRPRMLRNARSWLSNILAFSDLPVNILASPCISPAAQIHSNGDGNWSILENGEVRATYPHHAIRFSILWKAAIGDRQPNTSDLTLDHIMSTLTADLRRRRVDFQVPSDPLDLADTAWILLLQRIYADSAGSLRETIKDPPMAEHLAERIRLLGRQRLDDVQTGPSRDHLIETEPSLTQEVAIFLHGAFLPSGHEQRDYIRELSGRDYRLHSRRKH